MTSQKKSTKYGPGWRGPRFLRQGRQRRMLQEMTGQLADLVRLRVPLGEGISAMAVDAPDRKLRALFSVMGMDLQNGLSLHEALGRRSNFFPASYVDTVRVGEETGRLGTVLDRLHESQVRTGRFMDELAGHLFYLQAIFFAVLAVGTTAIYFLSNQFSEIFGSFGRTLPWVTQWLFWIHHAAPINFGWIGPWGVLLLAGAFTYLELTIPQVSDQRNRWGRFLWRILTHIPWVGPLYRGRDLAHVAQQLEMLTWAGLPLDEALDDAAKSNVSPMMSAALTRVNERVRQGLSFDDALDREKGLFPETFRGLVKLGTQAGALSETMGQLAQIYQGETLNRAHMMLNVGGPLGVCCVGAYVFLVCHGFYGTIFSLSSLVRQ